MSDKQLARRIANLTPEQREQLLQRLRHASAAAPLEAIPLVDRTGGRHRLSYSQQRLWFFDQLEPASHVYNLTSAMRWHGELDCEALERSAQAVIARHESLRTTFVELDRQPFQQVNAVPPRVIEQVDMRGLEEHERESALADLVTQNARSPFKLGTGPLYRITLVRLHSKQQALLVALHHSIADGSSLQIFLRELWSYYAGFVQGVPFEPEPLPVQYLDYSCWQHEQIEGDKLQHQLDYWKNQLRDAPPQLNLGEDFLRPALQEFDGGEIERTVPQPIAAGIDGLLRQERATLFMVLLTAFNVQLHRITGQDDIVVGTPVAGRRHQAVENLIGFFVNTLAIRSKVDLQLTFREYLRLVRSNVLGGFEHQDLPFSKLVQELRPRRDLSRTPIFQVALNVLNYSSGSVHVPGLTGERLDRPAEPSKFDLTLYATPREEHIYLTLVYNRKLFSQPRMELLLEQFEWILGQAVAHPDEPLGSLPLVSETARAILPDLRQPLPAVAQELPFHALLQHPPQQTALIDRHGQWTFADVEHRSNQLARHLLQSGFRKGDVVALLAHRSAWLPCAMLAVWKAGGVTLVLDPAYPAGRLAACLSQARPSVLINIESPNHELPQLWQLLEEGYEPRCITLRTGGANANPLLASYDGAPVSMDIRDTDPAYVAFTSGSTGQPKGVLGTHAAVAHFIAWQRERFGLNSQDRFGSLSGLSHDPLLRDLLAPLSCGATLVLPDQEELRPGNLSDWLGQQRITVAHMTPSMTMLLNHVKTDADTAAQPLDSLRYLFLGGEKLTTKHLQHLHTIAPNAQIVNFYGTTETPQAMGYYVVPRDSQRQPHLEATIPIGQPIADVQLLVLDSAGHQLGVGETGEIAVRTPYLSLGYLNDPELTASKFVPNPATNRPEDRIYRTGDLGRVRPDGQIDILGREDRQLNLRGFRIEPGEIETALCQHDQIAEAVAVVVEGSDRLVAYLRCHAGTLNLATLRASLRDRLPAPAIPAAFIQVDDIPRTPNGKIDFPALPDPDQAQVTTVRLNSEQLTALEQQLIEVWQRVLKTKAIGLHDDFFDLGGHSLLAVELFAEMEKVTQRKLPLSALFEAPTVAGLASLLEGESAPEAWSTLVTVQGHGSRPPLFCIHPLGGYALYYRDLAARLGPDQPFYALQSPGLDGQRAPFESAEELAAHYLDEIRSVQPSGPYFLGGLCFGGVLAFEMTRQLEQQGEQVGLLALFDTYTPAHAEKIKQAKSLGTAILRAMQRFDLEWSNLRALPWSRRAGYLRTKLITVATRVKRRLINSPGYLSPMGEGNPTEALIRVQQANVRILRGYVPTMLRHEITLFRATKQPAAAPDDATLGWGPVAGGGMKIHDIEGYHSTIAVEPNVGQLAERLRVCLREAELAVAASLAGDGPRDASPAQPELRNSQYSLS